jgi:outer membrane protein OmpA-like peptidoglycan-associated protein
MKLKAALFAATATIALAPAANAYEGLYGAIGAGLSYVGDDREVESIAGPVFTAVSDHQKGIGVYTALGYAYGNGFRTELEFSYRDNDARQWVGDGVTFSGFPEPTLDGDMSSYALMANLIYDFNQDGFLNPYIGAGAGYARLDADLVGVNPVAIGNLSPLLVDDHDWNFAYQGIAGLAIRIAEGLALDISYRYFATLSPEFTGTLAGAATTYETEYNSHTLFAGLRWNFGGGEAEVEYKDCWDGSSVPVSAECPPQLVEEAAAAPDPIEVIIYFDYDKSNLTLEAQQLIEEAAARAMANDIQLVKVEGNADRSGSSAYNQALSQRRANVVRDGLVAAGIPADRVETSAFGEDNPAKPTPDGVREPLNRRTEVRITFVERPAQ